VSGTREERVRSRQRGGEPLVAQQRALYRGIIERDPPVTDIDAPFFQRSDLLEGGELDECELDARADCAVASDQLGQPTV
jgi:hypothetical protein